MLGFICHHSECRWLQVTILNDDADAVVVVQHEPDSLQAPVSAAAESQAENLLILNIQIYSMV